MSQLIIHEWERVHKLLPTGTHGKRIVVTYTQKYQNQIITIIISP